MAKYSISFNGTCDESIMTTFDNDGITFYNDNDEIVTDTALATQYEVNLESGNALSLGFSNNQYLKSIEVSVDGLVVNENGGYTIKGGAFSDNSSLSYLDISNDFTIIETLAFENNPSLETVIVDGDLQEIPLGVFTGTTNINDIYVLPSSAVDVVKLVAFSNYPTLATKVKSEPEPTPIHIDGNPLDKSIKDTNVKLKTMAQLSSFEYPQPFKTTKIYTEKEAYFETQNNPTQILQPNGGDIVNFKFPK